MKISDDKMVSLIYDLTVDDNGQKELMEKATREQPLRFVFGMGMMLDAFEKNIEGLAAGDRFSFFLSKEEAYGEYFEEYCVEMPKTVFEVDGRFDAERVAEGETLPMMDSNGNRLMGSVLEVKQDAVVIDFNHPLAGETLHFEGEIIDVHAVSPEELAALMQEDSCGCGGCGDGEGKQDCANGCPHSK